METLSIFLVGGGVLTRPRRKYSPSNPRVCRCIRRESGVTVRSQSAHCRRPVGRPPPLSSAVSPAGGTAPVDIASADAWRPSAPGDGR